MSVSDTSTCSSGDDRVDLIDAVRIAETPPERRRFARIKRKVATQMTAWEVGQTARPFGVVIEDISERGLGIIHDEPLAEGKRFLLTVPRCQSKPVVVEVCVVRCEPRESAGLHHGYSIGLETATLIEDVQSTTRTMRLTSRRTRLLFLVFGILTLIIAAVVPL